MAVTQAMIRRYVAGARASGLTVYSLLFTAEGELELIVQPPAAPAVPQLPDLRSVAEFVSACLVPEVGAAIGARDLYLAYRTWCADRGQHPVGERRFAAGMHSCGVPKIKARIRQYIDHRFSPPEDQASSTG